MSADIERWDPPNDSTAFESLCLDLWRDIWQGHAQKNGRSGQPQSGIDVFGQHRGNWVGVQCKQKDGLLRSKLTTAELNSEVNAASKFTPPLSVFIVATTGPRDAAVQKRARELTEEHKMRGLFAVEIWSWDDIWPELYGREQLFKRIAPVYWPRRMMMRAPTTAVVSDPAEQSLVADELRWTDKLLSAKQVRNVLSNRNSRDQRYYRVIEMSAKGYEKNPRDLHQALKKSVIWRAEHQRRWPVSIGLAEYMAPTPSKTDGSSTTREVHSDGVTYTFTTDDCLEYVEARSHDCSVRIVETERAFFEGKLNADEEIGTISNALRFWTEFYTSLSMAGNYADFKITWHGLHGVRLAVGEKQFEGMFQEILLPSHRCDHSSLVESERLVSRPVSARETACHFDFLKRLSGHLFSQFNFFDPPESVIQAILRQHDTTST